MLPGQQNAKSVSETVLEILGQLASMFKLRLALVLLVLLLAVAHHAIEDFLGIFSVLS